MKAFQIIKDSWPKELSPDAVRFHIPEEVWEHPNAKRCLLDEKEMHLKAGRAYCPLNHKDEEGWAGAWDEFILDVKNLLCDLIEDEEDPMAWLPVDFSDWLNPWQECVVNGFDNKDQKSCVLTMCAVTGIITVGKEDYDGICSDLGYWTPVYKEEYVRDLNINCINVNLFKKHLLPAIYDYFCGRKEKITIMSADPAVTQMWAEASDDEDS